jgi:hypothetical protein
MFIFNKVKIKSDLIFYFYFYFFEVSKTRKIQQKFSSEEINRNGRTALLFNKSQKKKKNETITITGKNLFQKRIFFSLLIKSRINSNLFLKFNNKQIFMVVFINLLDSTSMKNNLVQVIFSVS